MRIVIPGAPIAQQRGKICTKGGFPRLYNPQESILSSAKQDFKLRWTKAISLESDKMPLESLIHVDLTFEMPLPLTISKPQKNAKLWGIETDRRDIDNLQKFIFDVMKGIAFADDHQIVSLTASKKYSLNPCTVINITPINKSMTFSAKEIIWIYSPQDLEDFEGDLLLLQSCLETFRTQRANKQENFDEIKYQLTRFANNHVPRLKKLIKKEAH